MKLRILPALVVLLALSACTRTVPEPDYVIGAYVFRTERGIPDPALVTHVNFAFAHVNETFDGVYIPEEKALRKVVRLKRGHPGLKVLLSVGGWGSGRFSEMAATQERREAFAASCRNAVRKFRLDGIDIDWEYPTRGDAGISSSPDDYDNFTLLMESLRKALGEEKMLTIATVSTAKYVDFPSILPYVDYVNVMAYDMNGELTYQEAAMAHIKAGVPPSKLVLGFGFHEKPTTKETAERCDFVRKYNFRGGMYWEWNSETDGHPNARVCSEILRNRPELKNVLLMYEDGGWHKALTDVLVPWLDSVSVQHGWAFTDVRDMSNATAEFLNDYDAILQVDCPPYPWPERAQNAFVDYITEGRGGYAGFHHASLLGEFDGFGMWQWFSDFLGGIRYDNYIAETCSGLVRTEDAGHPVMAGVSPRFTIPEDEWYTYDKSPRKASFIHVIANVDEDSYTSRVKMGDHPVIWTNTSVAARNVYFQFGHSPKLLDTPDYKRMMLNTLEWITGKE